MFLEHGANCVFFFQRVKEGDFIDTYGLFFFAHLKYALIGELLVEGVYVLDVNVTLAELGSYVIRDETQHLRV